MQLVNKTGLPEFVKRMVEKSNYPKHNWATFSVTELFKGPKEIILSRRHADEIEVDVAEMAAILVGNAVHDYLISVVGTQELSEERVNAPLDTQYGTIYISGAFDLYDAMAKHLYDVKVPSAMSLQFKAKDGYAEWKKQLRTYWWLLQRIGIEVQSASNLVISAGHSKHQARKNKDYPKFPIVEIKHEFPPVFNGEEEAEMRAEYIEIVEQVLKYKDTEDDLIPACSPEERWERDEHWAVMKEGRKTAVKRCYSDFEAQELAESLGKKHYVEHRPGSPVKCVDYCWARQHCSFYQNYMHGQKAPKEASHE